MQRLLTAAIGLAIAILIFEPAAAVPPPAGEQIQLPRDDGAHSSQLEWWYWTGHLRTPSNRLFGFELVFFQVHVFGCTFQVSHHAISDIQDESFHFRIERGKKQDDDGPVRGIDLSHAGLWARGGDGRDEIHGQVGPYQLDLKLAARKAPVLQHQRGHIEYDFGGHSYYYSRPRMDASGTLRIGDRQMEVTGSAWFDHQWGDMGEVFEQSWDWFGIQLDDNREIMVFRLRFGGQEKLRGGSYATASGQAMRLEPGEIEITPLGEWKSPHSGCTYPRQWRVKVADQNLLLTPVLQDQELWSSMPVYWEGAAVVSGTASGWAYIELNSYCR